MALLKQKLAVQHSDSLMDLLIAQCADLELLLALARSETAAAQKDDFGELLAVAQQRNVLGQRLEAYHQQIIELRGALGPSAAAIAETEIAMETVRIGMEIKAQDQQTTSLLVDARNRTSTAIAQLGNNQRNSLAYLRGGVASGLHCNRTA